ncbi:hypothetical protein FSP39_001353 [Pinctada imbricata]|uniref:B box-type domain-containing protein n=1 Tax=Pinctada imbricata TaxID=66713 RepID=A0AA88YWF6_PINIB|nr:hypothetical protein FSP39_001353 [Pinctada imbricata]
MERHCAPCKEEGKDVNATKQCHKCNVFLCEPCSENHKQEKSTEDHHVVDLEHFVKKSTSKNEPSTSQQKSSTFSEDELASDFLDTVTLTEDTVLYHGAQVAVESTSVTSKQEKLTASKQADPRRLKATACLEFSVKRSEDKKGVDVTGVLCLSDNIVVVDYGNDVLKLFDQDGIYLSSTPLKNDTWAITYVGDTLFATCGLINTIYLWTLHGKTIVCEDALHPVNPRAHGIHYNGTYFCLQHNWNNTITILDRQGRQVRKIIMKKACGKKFSFGFDIHMDTNNIYVPCSNEHGVLCMTIEGQALWFTSLLWTPCGITEIQGTLCVAAYYNHCLHLITKEGEYAKKLLDKADLRERPSYIFCGEDNILTIALDDFVCVLKYSKIVEEDFSDAEMNAITDFNRKKQIRFKSIDDIKLLREVVANNPFKNKGKWTEIAESLSKPGFILDGRRVRERTQLLIDQHRRENAENIKASGTDEVVEEKTTLLDEILELREEDEREKREEKDKKEKTENMGKEIRKRALECLTPQKGRFQHVQYSIFFWELCPLPWLLVHYCIIQCVDVFIEIIVITRDIHKMFLS